MSDEHAVAAHSVEVVVVTYQSAALLPGLFAALPDGLRVTVVDNASGDGSAEVAAAHGAEVIRNAVNAGFAVACNQGASLATAEVILFLNPDASVDAAALACVLRAFDDPTVGVASPRLRRADGSWQRVRWPYPGPARAWREAFGLGAGAPSGEGFVVGACFTVRRSAFEAVGGFDGRFWLYGEEAELCARLTDAGWGIVVVEGAVANHLGKASVDAHASTEASSRLTDEHFVRGGEHLVAKRQGRAALVSYRLANLLGSAVRGGAGLGKRAAEHRWKARRLASVLLHAPTTVALDSPATRAPGVGLVVCSLESWDEVWRRNQFLVRELLAADPHLRVLFVGESFDLLHERRLRRGRVHQRGLQPVAADGRVVAFEPFKWLPRRMGPWSERLRNRQVRRAVAALGFDRPTLWINDPGYASLLEEVDWPSTYDITDDWVAAPDPHVAAAAAADEATLLRRCDAVVVCSEDLARSRSTVRPDLVVVPNAVDVAHLRRPQDRPADLPPAPTALYVGTLHTDRLDVDLVAELAAARPDLHVVLVGPDALAPAAAARLAVWPNVVRLGARPFQAIPGYLQHADVVIVPHVVTPFTESLDPIKLYECLAIGRPTVATPVAGFRDETAPIHVAPRERFVGEVLARLDDPGPRPERRVPSWSLRAQDFAATLARSRQLHDRSPIRVAYFDHCARLSGGELALARTIPALHGVEALVLLGERGPLEGALAERGIAHEVLPLDEELMNTRRGAVTVGALPLRSLRAAVHDVRTLTTRLRELQPEILHTNSLKAALLGGVAGRLAGVPVVWHIRDRIAADYLPGPAVALVRAAARVLPSAVIANSESTRSMLGLKASRSQVVASPVVNDSVEAGSPAATPPASRPLRVAMVGRLAAWKGQDVFIDAFAQAFPDGDEVALVVGSAMFDEDEFAQRVVAQVEARGLRDRVTFTGFVDDVPGLLATCDVLVHASTIPEPFGQVVLEGMAAGLAVVASDAGGPAEVITHGVDGLLVAPGDVTALAVALRSLRDHPEQRATLRAGGALRVQDFTPEVVGAQIVSLYERVLGRRATRRARRPAAASS